MSRTINSGSTVTNRRGRGFGRGNHQNRNTNTKNHQYNSQQPNVTTDYTSENFDENRYAEKHWKASNTRGNRRGGGRNNFKNNNFKREAPARSHSSSSSSSSRTENVNYVHSPHNFSQFQGGRTFGTDSSRPPTHSKTPVFANELVHNFDAIMPPSELLAAEAPSFVQPRPPPLMQPSIFPNQGDDGRDMTFASISSNVTQGFRNSRSRSPKSSFGSGFQMNNNRGQMWPLENDPQKLPRNDVYQARSHPAQGGFPLPPPNRFGDFQSEVVNKARRNQILIDNGFKRQPTQGHVNQFVPSPFQNSSGPAGKNSNPPLLELPRQFANNNQRNTPQNGSKNFPLQDPKYANSASYLGKGLTHREVAGEPYNIRSPAGNPHRPAPSWQESRQRQQAEYNADAAQFDAKQREKEAKKREEKLAKYKYVDQGHRLTDACLSEAGGYIHGYGLISEEEVRRRQQEVLSLSALVASDRERKEKEERRLKEEEKKQKEFLKKNKFVDAGYKLGHGENKGPGHNRGGKPRKKKKATAGADNKSPPHSASPINPELLEGELLEDQLQMESVIYSEIARQKELHMNAEQQSGNSFDKPPNEGRSASISQSHKPGHQGQSTSQVSSVVSNATVTPGNLELAKQLLEQLDSLMAKPSTTPEEPSCIQGPSQSEETTITASTSGVSSIPPQVSGPEGDVQQSSITVTKPAQTFPLSSSQSIKQNVTVPPVNKEALEREILLRKLLAKSFVKLSSPTIATPKVQEASLVKNSKPQNNEQKIVNAENENQKAEEERRTSWPGFVKKKTETTVVVPKINNHEVEEKTKTTQYMGLNQNLVVEETNISNPGIQIQQNETVKPSKKPSSCVLKNPSIGATLVLRPTEGALQQALLSHLEVQDEMDKKGYSALYTPTVHEPPEYVNNRFDGQATGAVPKRYVMGSAQNGTMSNNNQSTSASETNPPAPVIDHQAELRAARLRMQMRYEESLKKAQENSSTTTNIIS